MTSQVLRKTLGFTEDTCNFLTQSFSKFGPGTIYFRIIRAPSKIYRAQISEGGSQKPAFWTIITGNIGATLHTSWSPPLLSLPTNRNQSSWGTPWLARTNSNGHFHSQSYWVSQLHLMLLITPFLRVLLFWFLSQFLLMVLHAACFFSIFFIHPSSSAHTLNADILQGYIQAYCSPPSPSLPTGR